MFGLSLLGYCRNIVLQHSRLCGSGDSISAIFFKKINLNPTHWTLKLSILNTFTLKYLKLTVFIIYLFKTCRPLLYYQSLQQYSNPEKSVILLKAMVHLISCLLLTFRWQQPGSEEGNIKQNSDTLPHLGTFLPKSVRPILICHGGYVTTNLLIPCYSMQSSHCIFSFDWAGRNCL